jgi:hypothetical protein
MIIRLTTFIAAACVILGWDQRRRAREQQQALQRSRAQPADVSAWEGEGGALPTVGSQLGPAPVRKP